MKTYAVPIVKKIHTTSYIKARSREEAVEKLKQDSTVVYIGDDVEELKPFKLGDTGDDRPT